MSDASMRAVVQHTFGGPDVLSVQQVPRPEPLPTEVRVKVHAAGINPVDWKTRAGDGMAGVLGEPPFVLGWDVSGVVEEVGFGVTTLREGDEVYGMPWFPRAAGGYAEYVTAPARQFARKPSSVSHEQAAAVPLAALTAWQALVDTAQRPARAAGADPRRRRGCRAPGGPVRQAPRRPRARHGPGAAATTGLPSSARTSSIDYTAVRFEDVASDVDVVLDLVGDVHDNTSTRSLDVLRPGGLLVAVPAGVSPELAAAAEAKGKRVSPFLVEPDGPALTTIGALIDAGEVVVEVEEVFPLEQVAEAHSRGESNRTRGKLVLRVAS